MQTPSCIQKALLGSNFPELLHEAAEADSDFVGLYLRNDMVQYVPLLFRTPEQWILSLQDRYPIPSKRILECFPASHMPHPSASRVSNSS